MLYDHGHFLPPLTNQSKGSLRLTTAIYLCKHKIIAQITRQLMHRNDTAAAPTGFLPQPIVNEVASNGCSSCVWSLCSVRGNHCFGHEGASAFAQDPMPLPASLPISCKKAQVSPSSIFCSSLALVEI